MMTIFPILLTLIGTNAEDSTKPRVVGGELAQPGQFPYAAALKISGNHVCGGSIVSKRWILTAAHCLHNSQYTIILGTTSLTEGGTKYKVIKKIPHEAYNSTTYQNDIGLVKTDREIKFNNFTQPIMIASVKDGVKVFGMGWGHTEGLRGAQQLKFIESTVMSQEKCEAAAKKSKAVVSQKNVCVEEVAGRGMCFGDSGGPLVADGKQVGIVSYALQACAKGEPDVFTRTASYSSWINKHASECVRF